DTGDVTTKPERIALLRSGDLKFEKVEFEEVSVRSYGDAAVATLRALATGTLKGKTQNMDERVTLVAAKEADGWRLVSGQITPIVASPKIGGSSNTAGSASNT